VLPPLRELRRPGCPRAQSPADLPIGQPARFELVFNLRAANAIDVEAPDFFPGAPDRITA